MTRLKTFIPMLAVLLLLIPLVALAITEPKTETSYPDQETISLGGETITMVASGIGLREKTIMKVDVYLIVSYVDIAVDLGDKPADAIRTLDVAKRIQMDLRRGFSREKLANSFSEVIAKNYDDMTAFEADLDVFLAYFDRDAQENDRLVFESVPGVGLTTFLNGKIKGTIRNPAFTEALWTVWFGEKPADGGLKKALVSAL